MNRIILTLTASISIAIIVYSALSMFEVEGYPAKLIAALGIFISFSLFLSGLIDAKTAQKGSFATVVLVLPRLLDWAARFNRRTFAISAGSIVLAAMVYWIGPLGVEKISIACDQADNVTFGGIKEMPCLGALNVSLWRTPVQRYNNEEVILTCTAQNGDRIESWEGNLKNKRCGRRPLSVEYIVNGISIPSKINENRSTSVESQRIYRGLQDLRKHLKSIPKRNKTDNLIFATWNLRYFGATTPFRIRYGTRNKEALLYMAEVLSHFDLIAVQEIFDETLLKQLVQLLGTDYAFTLGAPSPGSCGLGSEGLGARLGFIYDRRKLKLQNENSTVVVDPSRNVTMLEKYPEWSDAFENFQTQPCRPPFLSKFEIQGLRFSVFTLHAYYGSSRGIKFQRRLIDNYRVFDFFARYSENKLPNEVMLFGGDLNAIKPDGPVQQIVEKLGFSFLGPSYQIPTNLHGSYAYDRIGGIFPHNSRIGSTSHGALDLFAIIFRDDQIDAYRPYFKEKYLESRKNQEVSSLDDEMRFFREWRGFMVSDHRPRWVQFILLPNLENK